MTEKIAQPDLDALLLDGLNVLARVPPNEEYRSALNQLKEYGVRLKFVDDVHLERELKREAERRKAGTKGIDVMILDTLPSDEWQENTPERKSFPIGKYRTYSGKIGNLDVIVDNLRRFANSATGIPYIVSGVYDPKVVDGIDAEAESGKIRPPTASIDIGYIIGDAQLEDRVIPSIIRAITKRTPQEKSVIVTFLSDPQIIQRIKPDKGSVIYVDPDPSTGLYVKTTLNGLSESYSNLHFVRSLESLGKLVKDLNGRNVQFNVILAKSLEGLNLGDRIPTERVHRESDLKKMIQYSAPLLGIAATARVQALERRASYLGSLDRLLDKKDSLIKGDIVEGLLRLNNQKHAIKWMHDVFVDLLINPEYVQKMSDLFSLKTYHRATLKYPGYGFATGTLNDMLMQHLTIKNPDRMSNIVIGEYGHGPLTYTMSMMERVLETFPNASFVLIDPDESSYEMARTRFEMSGMKWVAEDQKLPPRSVKLILGGVEEYVTDRDIQGLDAWVSMFSLHHVKDEHKKTALKVTGENLKEGGIHLIGDVFLTDYTQGGMRPYYDSNARLNAVVKLHEDTQKLLYETALKSQDIITRREIVTSMVIEELCMKAHGTFEHKIPLRTALYWLRHDSHVNNVYQDITSHEDSVMRIDPVKGRNPQKYSKESTIPSGLYIVSLKKA